MKTIAVLLMSAALLCAQDQAKDQSPAKTSKDQTKDRKTLNADRAVAPSRQTRAQSAPARATRKVRQPTVTPQYPALTPQQKAAAALPSVPEGAKEVGPNLYSYTDAQGKNWMYRKTPFGVSKWEGKPGEEQPDSSKLERPTPAATTATDLGDSVRFQRLTPFGPQTWTRKKSELSDDEKAVLAAQNAKQAAESAKPADAAKPPEKQ